MVLESINLEFEDLSFTDLEKLIHNSDPQIYQL